MAKIQHAAYGPDEIAHLRKKEITLENVDQHS